MKNIKNSNEYAFGLIIEEMEGFISESEQQELSQWIASDPENKRTYEEFRNLNDRLELLATKKDLNADESWEILANKLEISDEPVRSLVYRNRWWSAAAAVVITLAAGLYFMNNFSQVTYATTANEQRKVDLPDGSSVLVSRNTVIKFDESRFATNRKISLLKGEAFFTVVHDPAHQFTVDLGKIEVTDLGTSFNIVRSSAMVQVTVNSGKVAFRNRSSDRLLLLDQGETGVYREEQGVFASGRNTDPNYKAWADKKLTFLNEPLNEVARSLEKTYGTTVELRGRALSGRKLNATLNYQSADSALLVIAESLHLNLKKQGSSFILGE